MASSGGLVQVFRETGSLYPVIHFGEIRKKKAPPVLKPGQKPTDVPEPGARGEKLGDPFSAPAGQDPFAAPPAGAGGAGAGGAAPAADPFAQPPAGGGAPP
jgi:hypothetical protein